MQKIYVCSALRGDMESNIQKARVYCEFVVREHAMIPIAPHIYLTQFLNDENAEDREFGLKAGLSLLSECDELWYFGDGVTRDMVDAILAAHEKGIPVKYIPPMKMAALSCQKECIRERRDAFLNLNNDENGGK